MGKNSQILRNPVKFAFLTTFGYLGSDVMVLHLPRGPKLGDSVCSCSLCALEDLTAGEESLIRFLV